VCGLRTYLWSLDVLDLLTDLLQLGLGGHDEFRHARVGGLVPGGVQLAEDLLYEEIDPLSDGGPGRPEQRVDGRQVGREPVALLGDVEPVEKDRRLLVEADRIDPRLGRPISHDLASVSVVEPSCMTADALATALEVLGPVEGMALATSHDIPALFLVRMDDGTFRELKSPVWSVLVENSAGGNRVDQSGS